MNNVHNHIDTIPKDNSKSDYKNVMKSIYTDIYNEKENIAGLQTTEMRSSKNLQYFNLNSHHNPRS